MKIAAERSSTLSPKRSSDADAELRHPQIRVVSSRGSARLTPLQNNRFPWFESQSPVNMKVRRLLLFGLSLGVTIVVGATKTEATTTDASAFDILREVTKDVTPAKPINF